MIDDMLNFIKPGQVRILKNMVKRGRVAIFFMHACHLIFIIGINLGVIVSARWV